MSSVAYPARIWQEDDGSWQVEFPDVRGAITAGASLEEAKEMAVEALSGVLASRLDHGEAISRPTSLTGPDIFEIEADPVVAAPILLRWAREEAHLTQSDLAQRLGLTYQAVQKLERSGANPSLRTLRKVARALGRDLHIAI